MTERNRGVGDGIAEHDYLTVVEIDHPIIGNAARRIEIGFFTNVVTE